MMYFALVLALTLFTVPTGVSYHNHNRSLHRSASQQTPSSSMQAVPGTFKPCCSTQAMSKAFNPRSSVLLLAKKKITKITPNEGESMDEYRKSVLRVIKAQEIDDKKLGGREILNLLITKWGAAYDLQIRKNTPFGDESANVYVNVMWQYYGQKSFRLGETEYLQHLEAIGQYVTAIGKTKEFRETILKCRKRPNSYFGYAVPIPLNVKPETADRFFKNLKSYYNQAN